MSDPYATEAFRASLAAATLAPAAIARYCTQHEAAHRALDADGVPREGRRRWVVPGRIEVLGKHTDYAGGRSLLCAVERGLVVVAAPRRDRVVRVLDAVRQGTVDLDLNRASALRNQRGWSLYPTTVARRLVRNFGDLVGGAHLALASGLPSAAGMSSSSALTVGIALALAHCGGLAEQPAWRDALPTTLDLAGYLGALENGLRFRSLEGDTGVGTLGGAQDHTAILCSAAGTLVQCGWAPPTIERWVPCVPHHVFVVAVSGVVASKAGAARGRYNRAARTVAHLLRTWNLRAHRRDATLGEALRSHPDAFARLEAWARIDATPEFPSAHLLGRLTQFREESEVLVPGAGDALTATPPDLPTFGRLVRQSQAGAEAALENQVPETRWLARAAVDDFGAVAASAFGAGFGGSVWALVPRAEAESFTANWRRAYHLTYPDVAARSSWLGTRPSPPALEVARGG